MRFEGTQQAVELTQGAKSVMLMSVSKETQ